MKVYAIMQEMDEGEDKLISVNSTQALAEDWMKHFRQSQPSHDYYIQEWDVE